jgi:hypothetical protein
LGIDGGIQKVATSGPSDAITSCYPRFSWKIESGISLFGMAGFPNQGHSNITPLQGYHGTKSLDRKSSLLAEKWDFPGQVGFLLFFVRKVI